MRRSFQIKYLKLNIKNDELLSGDDDVLILDNLYVEKNLEENISELVIEALCNDFRRLGRFAFHKLCFTIFWF